MHHSNAALHVGNQQLQNSKAREKITKYKNYYTNYQNADI